MHGSIVGFPDIHKKMASRSAEKYRCIGRKGNSDRNSRGKKRGASPARHIFRKLRITARLSTSFSGKIPAQTECYRVLQENPLSQFGRDGGQENTRGSDERPPRDRGLFRLRGNVCT